MTTDNTQHEEIRHRFEHELDEIKQGTVQLCSLVLENTKRLGEALVDNRLDLAQQVVDADREVDERYSVLERKTFLAIALQQPVAVDLRFLVSMTRLLYEIERSGDLAVNAAAGMLRRNGYDLAAPVHGLLARICQATPHVLAMAIDALDEMDPNAAVVLDEEDDVVDQLVGQFYALIASESAELDMQSVIDLSRTARYLERIADHAVNIGDHVCYVVTGSFPAHSVEAAPRDRSDSTEHTPPPANQ
jgi:phosphate transport system protein